MSRAETLKNEIDQHLQRLAKTKDITATAVGDLQTWQTETEQKLAANRKATDRLTGHQSNYKALQAMVIKLTLVIETQSALLHTQASSPDIVSREATLGNIKNYLTALSTAITLQLQQIHFEVECAYQAIKGKTVPIDATLHDGEYKTPTIKALRTLDGMIDLVHPPRTHRHDDYTTKNAIQLLSAFQAVRTYLRTGKHPKSTDEKFQALRSHLSSVTDVITRAFENLQTTVVRPESFNGIYPLIKAIPVDLLQKRGRKEPTEAIKVAKIFRTRTANAKLVLATPFSQTVVTATPYTRGANGGAPALPVCDPSAADSDDHDHDLDPPPPPPQQTNEEILAKLMQIFTDLNTELHKAGVETIMLPFAENDTPGYPNPTTVKKVATLERTITQQRQLLAQATKTQATEQAPTHKTGGRRARRLKHAFKPTLFGEKPAGTERVEPTPKHGGAKLRGRHPSQ